MAELAAMAGELVRLRAEVARDRGLVTKLGDEVAAAAATMGEEPSAPTLAYVAVQIHRFYTALESILERIERTYGTEPRGADSHVELLRGAALELPGLRPAVLPTSAMDDLREVLRFRHFFRHAYAVELDAKKILGVVAHVRSAAEPVQIALRQFEAFLQSAAEEMLRAG